MAKDDLTELRDLAEGVVDRARKAGADVAEVGARKGYDLSVRVRLGATELVEEAGHRGISLRVIRSQRVAAFLHQNGFDSLANVAGGIDAWSAQHDPSVPRY